MSAKIRFIKIDSTDFTHKIQFVGLGEHYLACANHNILVFVVEEGAKAWKCESPLHVFALVLKTGSILKKKKSVCSITS